MIGFRQQRVVLYISMLATATAREGVQRHDDGDYEVSGCGHLPMIRVFEVKEGERRDEEWVGRQCREGCWRRTSFSWLPNLRFSLEKVDEGRHDGIMLRNGMSTRVPSGRACLTILSCSFVILPLKEVAIASEEQRTDDDAGTLRYIQDCHMRKEA